MYAAWGRKGGQLPPFGLLGAGIRWESVRVHESPWACVSAGCCLLLADIVLVDVLIPPCSRFRAVNVRWYANDLGLRAKHSFKQYQRQDLIGGRYGLLGIGHDNEELRTEDAVRINPDFWVYRRALTSFFTI